MGATRFPNGIGGKTGSGKVDIIDDINLTAGKVVKQNGTELKDVSETLTNKTISAASNTITGITTTNLGVGVLDTDGTLTENSDTKIASQKAVKTYADSKMAKVASPVNNNLIKQDADGNAVNAGVAINDAGTGTATLWTASKVQTLIDGVSSGQGAKLAAPVQDVAALKALNTTNTTTWPDKIMILVEGTGLYRLDQNDSTTVGDDNRVVTPTEGTGRWFKMSSAINDHNNLSTIQKSSTNAGTEAYHLKQATVESLEAATAQLDQLKTTGTPTFAATTQATTNTDTILEKTVGNGVTIDGVKLKDGIINSFTFTAASGAAQVVKTLSAVTAAKFIFHVKDATGAVMCEVLATKLDQASTTGDWTSFETNAIGTMTTYTDYGVTFTNTDISLIINTSGAGAVVTGSFEIIK